MKKIKYKKIEIYYNTKYNGGGLSCAIMFTEIFKKFNIPKQKNLCEWCCGPAFIGFSLLDHDYCDKLHLTDFNQDLKPFLNKTIEENKLHDKVDVIYSNNLDGIFIKEKWDFIVGNPPFFKSKTDAMLNTVLFERGKVIDNSIFFKDAPTLEELKTHFTLVYDKDFNLHKDFFKRVNNYLNENGVILLIEMKSGSQPDDFESMISNNKLKIVKVLDSKSNYYFLFIMRENNDVPSWLLNS